ncbi:hypothetical protein RZ532_22285 [Nitratireductor aquimarinus]|uniref:hypothetical protein n=1 Tax=Nitratireductor aquimarinus TaxID=889300 RepID=UPI002935D015|nr:hypothetical protein [Nitratireductor aquimarinus]MDV2968721.1 hypothetical protein [Nitratireductor aquimarinus]
MAKKFVADGNTGRVAIFDPAKPAAWDDPINNLDAVYFHSELDYLGVAKVLDVTVTHPARGKGATTTLHNYAVPNPFEGEVGNLTHNLGYVPHGVCFVGNDMLPANTQIQHVGSSFRTVAIELTTTQVKIYETAWIYQHALPAITKTYKVLLFTPPLGGDESETLRIEPTRFIASKGKLDSNHNYIRRAPTNPMFWFSKGKTADAGNGSFKIVTANGSVITRSPYDEGFSGIQGIGVEI